MQKILLINSYVIKWAWCFLSKENLFFFSIESKFMGGGGLHAILTCHGRHGDLWTHDIGDMWPDVNCVGLPWMKGGKSVITDEYFLWNIDLVGMVWCQIQGVVINNSIGWRWPINIKLSATDGSDVYHLRGIWHCSQRVRKI